MRLLFYILLITSSVWACPNCNPTVFPQIPNDTSKLVFMTATVTDIVVGDTILPPPKDTTVRYRKHPETGEICRVKIIPRPRRKKPMVTPAKVFVRPDSDSDIFPIDKQMYLTFFKGRVGVSNKPVRYVTDLERGDKLFIIHSTYKVDTSQADTLINVPFVEHATFGICRKYDEIDKTYEYLTYDGKLSSDSSIALLQLCFQIAKASNRQRKVPLLEEVLTYPPMSPNYFDGWGSIWVDRLLLRNKSIDWLTDSEKATYITEHKKRWGYSNFQIDIYSNLPKLKEMYREHQRKKEK